MAGHWIAAQLAVGSVERGTFTDSQIEDAIARGKDLARLDALLLWPAADPKLMERLVRACRESPRAAVPLVSRPLRPARCRGAG